MDHVFVIGTGRCGTTTMARACGHADNWACGHESRARLYGDARFDYPERHIEVDARLAWFLGELGQRFPGALYVHLVRDPEPTAKSIARRWNNGRIGFTRAFGESMVMQGKVDDEETRLETARFMVRTILANISLFLGSVSRKMVVRLELAKLWFPRFWDRIGATGDLSAALSEWNTRYNASPEPAAC